MAGLHLVTGYKGSAHITSADQGAFNAYLLGTDEYVLTKGKIFESLIINSNLVRIYDGSLMINGRYVDLPSGSYLDVTIENGTQNMNRHDIIAIRYQMDASTGVESVSLVVIKGTASSGTPTDPSMSNTGSILNGVTVHDMPLYRVILEGLTIVKTEPLFQVLPPMADIRYKPNLLINGDFQVNQRGKKSYDTTGKTGYTVDMWRGYQVNVKPLINGGVEVTSTTNIADDPAYFTQFVELGKLESKTYTISARVDDKICTFTLTPGGVAKDKDFGKFKISALTTSKRNNAKNDYINKLKVNIVVLEEETIKINYVDVFEGVVAYPHVKEDYGTALMRCQAYIQHGRIMAPIISYAVASNTGHNYRFGVTFGNMEPYHTATLEQCDWNYFTDDSTTPTASGSVTGLTIMNTTDCLFECRSNSTYKMSTDSHAIRVNYVVSCEPYPTGD